VGQVEIVHPVARDPLLAGHAQEKDRLIKRYWKIPERQSETSLVLTDPKWWELNHNRMCKS
jgi:hypothetical protein